METDAIEITFDNTLAELLAAERLYYKSTWRASVDKVVACVAVLWGVFAVWAVGVRWWTVIAFPLALAEWLNLLSLRPL